MSIVSPDLLSQDIRQVVLAPSVLLKLRVSSLSDAEYLQLVTHDLAQGLSAREWGEQMERRGALTVADLCWQVAGWDSSLRQEHALQVKKVWEQRIHESMESLRQQLQRQEVKNLLSQEEMAAYNTELRDIGDYARKGWYDLAQEYLEPLNERLQATVTTREQEKEQARTSLLRARIEVLNQLTYLQPFPSGPEGYRAVERLLTTLEQWLNQPEWNLQRTRALLDYAHKLCGGEAYNPHVLSRLLGEWVVIESQLAATPVSPALEQKQPTEPEAKVLASSSPAEEARPQVLLNQADLERQERSDKLLRSGNYQRTVAKNFKQAERFYKEALRVWAGNEAAAKNLANMLRQQKRTEAAIAILEEGVKHAQEPLPFYNLLTNYCTDIGQFDRAREHAKSALRLVGDARAEIGVLTSLVTLEVKDRDIPKALEYIEAILRINPYHEDTLLNKKRLRALLATGATASSDEPVLESAGSGLADLAIEVSSSVEFSPLIREDLEACELSGIAPTILQSSDNGKVKAEAERLYQETLDLNFKQYRERTTGFLRVAKLLAQMVGNEKEGEISAELLVRALCLYTDIMGDYLSARGSLDAARDYYLEYVRLYEYARMYKRSNAVWSPRSLAKYFQTFVSEAQRSLLDGLMPRTFAEMSSTQIQTTMRQFFEKVEQSVRREKESGPELARSLLELACANDLIADTIARALKQSTTLQNTFLPLMRMLPGQNSLEVTRDEPDEVFRQRVQHRHFSIKRQERLLSRLVANMGEKRKLKQAHEELRQVKSYEEEWNKSDRTYFAKVLELVRKGSDYFAREGHFHEKAPLGNTIINDAETFQKDLIDNPTFLGKAYFARIVYQLKRLMEEELEEGRQRSLPRLEPRVVKSVWAPDKQGQVLECQIEITNTGESTAQNVKIRLLLSETGDYLLQNELYLVGSIYPGRVGTKIISLALAKQVANPDTDAINLLLRLEYSDRDNREYETLPVRLRLSLQDTIQFTPIEKNPYSPTKPPVGPMFIGREELINELARAMTHEDHTGAVMLYGQKRCGKTSILMNLEKELERLSSPLHGRIVPVYFSMQAVLGTDDNDSILPGMFYLIAYDITRKCKEAGLEQVPHLEWNKLVKPYNPVVEFRLYLDTIRHLPGMRRLVLLIDEFTRLSNYIDEGRINSGIMQALKSLIEQQYFSCLICGIDTMPEVLRKYPNELAVTQRNKIGYLSPEAARKLIEEPVRLQDGSSRFHSPQVVDELLKLTAGNPYYIQVFGYHIVEYINEKKYSRITLADLESIVDDLISGASASDQYTQFDNLTRYRDDKALDTRETIIEGLFLYLLADEMRTYAGHSPVPFQNIRRRAPFLEEQELLSVAERLEEQEVIKRTVINTDRHYHIIVDFFRRWINSKRRIDKEMINTFTRQIKEKAEG